VLNEGTLVLEGVTLAQVVELVVKVLVDLAGGAVLDQQTTEDTETTHPHNLAVGNCQPQFHPHANPRTPCNPPSERLAPIDQSFPFIPSRVGEETHLGIRASAVPFLLPKPRCLPMRRAAVSSRARARECMVTGFLMMRPSEMSLRTVARELALEISVTSLGSSQILRLPQPATALARRFWVRRLTLQRECISICVLG
jgi:hypothetical protein